MKKLQKTTVASLAIAATATIAGGALFFGAMFAHAQTAPSVALANHQLLSSQLGIGSSGSGVSELQTFLATNTYVYPQGIVSGYYGSLTANAVSQFQIAYGLPPVGNVGPLTLAKINSLLASGVTTLDVNAPIVTSLQVSTSANTATITWTTNEAAVGKVHYDTVPLVESETSVAMTEPAISGNVTAETSAGFSHSITLTNLVANQTYNFVAESDDSSGNVSVTVPMTFVTK